MDLAPGSHNGVFLKESFLIYSLTFCKLPCHSSSLIANGNGPMFSKMNLDFNRFVHENFEHSPNKCWCEIACSFFINWVAFSGGVSLLCFIFVSFFFGRCASRVWFRLITSLQQIALPHLLGMVQLVLRDAWFTYDYNTRSSVCKTSQVVTEVTQLSWVIFSLNLSTYQTWSKKDILGWNDKKWLMLIIHKTWNIIKKHTSKLQDHVLLTTFLSFNQVLTCRQTSTAPAMFVAISRHLRCWGCSRYASTTPLSVEQMMLLKGVPEVCQTLIINKYGYMIYRVIQFKNSWDDFWRMELIHFPFFELPLQWRNVDPDGPGMAWCDAEGICFIFTF